VTVTNTNPTRPSRPFGRLLGKSAVLVALLGGAFATTACRGGISTSPPVHLVHDMDFQAKVKAQAVSKFFADGRGMRTPPAGTIPHGYTYTEGTTPDEASVAAAQRLAELRIFKDAAGGYLTRNPVAPSQEVLARGQERYDIYCSVCHGLSGRGGFGKDANGTVGARWPIAIPSFIDDPLVSKNPDGQIFETITNGKGTMPAYGHMVSVEDRWSIVHYIRALQFQAENQ